MKGFNKTEEEKRNANKAIFKQENEEKDAEKALYEQKKEMLEKNKAEDLEKDTLLASEEETIDDIEIEFPEAYGKEEVEAIKKFAKSLKLNKDQALGLAKLSKQLEENSKQKQAEQQKNWEEELENDSEVGKKNFLKNLEYAKIALHKFDTNNELRTLLNESGYGSHPIVVKFFINLGKKLNEDRFVHGENAKKNKPLYERLYK